MTSYWDYDLFGNSLEQYLVAFCIYLLVFWSLTLVKNLLTAHLKNLSAMIPGSFDNLILEIISKVASPLVISISLYVTSRFLLLHPMIGTGLKGLLVITITWEAIQAAQVLVRFIAKRHLDKHKQTNAPSDATLVHSLSMIANIAIWIIAGLLLLSNLGYNVNALIASLGIGGLAVAFAAQNLLGDLFSSLSIFFDKPFAVGDFIQLDTQSGFVEKVGLRSTHIKTLQGQILIVSNSDITKARIENFHRMNHRRVEFLLGVTYETSPEKLTKIPRLIKEVIDFQENAELVRCYFKSYGDFALIYEVVFNITTRSYQTYVNTHHDINLAIKTAFTKAKIDFAYPTQTVYVKK